MTRPALVSRIMKVQQQQQQQLLQQQKLRRRFPTSSSYSWSLVRWLCLFTIGPSFVVLLNTLFLTTTMATMKNDPINSSNHHEHQQAAASRSKNQPSCQCDNSTLTLISDFGSASGQDKFLWEHIFSKENQDHGLCCRGVFVEFGARDGLQDSNTLFFERKLKWKGLLLEMNSNGEDNNVKKKYDRFLAYFDVIGTFPCLLFGLERLACWKYNFAFIDSFIHSFFSIPRSFHSLRIRNASKQPTHLGSCFGTCLSFLSTQRHHDFIIYTWVVRD
jgi:hypothetical protein